MLRSIKFAALLAVGLLVSSVADAQSIYNQMLYYPGTGAGGIAPATPAATSLKSSAGNLLSIICMNENATPVFVKMWNIASGSVTLGTTAATFQYMCPGNTAGAGFVIPFPWPLSFTTAMTYAVTGGISAADNTAITANTVIVQFEYL